MTCPGSGRPVETEEIAAGDPETAVCYDCVSDQLLVFEAGRYWLADHDQAGDW